MDPRIREALWEAWREYWEGMDEESVKELFEMRIEDPELVWVQEILMNALKILARNADANS